MLVVIQFINGKYGIKYIEENNSIYKYRTLDEKPGDIIDWLILDSYLRLIYGTRNPWNREEIIKVFNLSSNIIRKRIFTNIKKVKFSIEASRKQAIEFYRRCKNYESLSKN